MVPYIIRLLGGRRIRQASGWFPRQVSADDQARTGGRRPDQKNPNSIDNQTYKQA
jgi:hypothetical protein